ncbi:MAG: PQQ-binding-like beta-propeller repeat protein, partial [Actinobacteria bacterium]|nr:PQQ-binding-like beta-propeller repeat protein [Actinomycetota bacterium]
MDATQIRNLIECPNCGGKLPPAAADGSRTCDYCETVFAPPPNPHVPPPMSVPPNLGGWSAGAATSSSPAAGQPTYVAPVSAKGCGVGALIITLFLITGIAIPLFFVLRGANFSTVFADKPDGRVAVLPSTSGPASIFTFIRRAGTSSLSLVRFDPPSKQPVWISAEITGAALAQTPIIANGTYVIFPNGTNVLAYRVDNGTLAWQAPISDQVSAGSCDSCLFFAGDRVIVKSTDYTFHAIDPATGAVAWSRKAVTPSAWAAPFGDKVMLLDDNAEHGGQVVLIKPDGSEETVVQPVCPADTKGFDAGLDTTAVVFPLPNENAAVFGYGSPYSCWQRIDFSTSQPAWTAKIPQGSSTPRRDDSFVVSQGAKAAVVTGGTVAALDLATGDYKPLPKVADTKLYPLGIRENVVV